MSTVYSYIDVCELILDKDLHKVLCLFKEIEALELEITYSYTPSVPSTMTDPAWESEIEVEEVNISDCFVIGGTVVLSDRQARLILNCVPEEVIELACWEHVETINKHEGIF